MENSIAVQIGIVTAVVIVLIVIFIISNLKKKFVLKDAVEKDFYDPDAADAVDAAMSHKDEPEKTEVLCYEIICEASSDWLPAIVYGAQTDTASTPTRVVYTTNEDSFIIRAWHDASAEGLYYDFINAENLLKHLKETVEVTSVYATLKEIDTLELYSFNKNLKAIMEESRSVQIREHFEALRVKAWDEFQRISLAPESAMKLIEAIKNGLLIRSDYREIANTIHYFPGYGHYDVFVNNLKQKYINVEAFALCKDNSATYDFELRESLHEKTQRPFIEILCDGNVILDTQGCKDITFPIASKADIERYELMFNELYVLMRDSILRTQSMLTDKTLRNQNE